MMSKKKGTEKNGKKFASMIMAGMLALSMGVSAVAVPCTALAQETLTKEKELELERDDRHISPQDAIQVVLNHAYDRFGITPDKVWDLKVEHNGGDWDLPLYTYFVTFYSNANTRRDYRYQYLVDATNGFIEMYGC
ncbi:MAG: hypothetical protein Q4B54_14725 [Coriobacteriales bacterium]|nr:hypothetical protein [Coriobacteriales bacterium]